MSRNYWIKTELGRHFPNLNFEEGVDFDRNGRIEGLERTDLDQNETVDPIELDLFLRANHYVLRNELGGFFKPFYSRGRDFRLDNPIHDRFLIESELVSPHLIMAAYRKVKRILDIVKRRAHLSDDPKSKLKLVYDAMKEVGIVFRNQKDSLFAENLRDGVFDCEASSLVVLAVAHELNWPVYLVGAPGHVFVRWDEGDYKFNMDILNMDNGWHTKNVGNIYSDQRYKKFFNVSSESVENEIYLSNISPNKMLAFYLRSRAFGKEDRRDFEGAIADFTEAIKLDPTDSQAYANRGMQKRHSGDLVGAIADFVQAIKLDPNDSLAYYGLALIMKVHGDLNSAIVFFMLAIKANPGNYYAYIEIEDAVDLEAAITVYTEIIKLVPSSGIPYFFRGQARSMLGDLEGSIADYTEGLKLNANDYEAHCELGSVRRRSGDLEGAITNYIEAIKIYPADSWPYRGIFNIQAERGDMESALATFTELLELAPGVDYPYYYRGRAKDKLGDSEGAIADYTEAIKRTPRSYSYYYRGCAKRKTGDLKGAIADYTEAIKRDPNNGTVYYHRGRARHESGNLEGAIADYTKAMELKFGESAAYSGRGTAEMKLGRYARAREDFLRAREIGPDDKVARSNLIKLAFIPDHLNVAIGPRIGSDNLGASLAVSATWPSFHIDESLKTGPHLEVGYGPDHSHHSLNFSAGWAIMNKSKNSTVSAEVGVGYNFALAGDASGAPIGDGAFFQYGLRYHHRVTDSLGIGASVMVQHELPNPQHLAVLPRLELTYHLW